MPGNGRGSIIETRIMNYIPRTIVYVFAELCKHGRPTPIWAAYQVKKMGLVGKALVDYAKVIFGNVWAEKFAVCF